MLYSPIKVRVGADIPRNICTLPELGWVSGILSIVRGIGVISDHAAGKNDLFFSCRVKLRERTRSFSTAEWTLRVGMRSFFPAERNNFNQICLDYVVVHKFLMAALKQFYMGNNIVQITKDRICPSPPPKKSMPPCPKGLTLQNIARVSRVNTNFEIF